MNGWKPKVGSGYFYIGDAQYYLFAGKKTVYLEDITWYVYPINEFGQNKKLQNVTEAKYGTYKINSQNIRIEGDEIWINLGFLNPTGYLGYSSVNIGEHEILLSYTYALEESGAVVQKEEENVLIVPALLERRYFLDPIPVPNTPIILTNDEVSPGTEEQYLFPQFSVDYHTGEVLFLSHGNRNLLQNPLFSCIYTYDSRHYPCDWAVKSDDVTSLFATLKRGYVGRRSYLLGNVISKDGIYKTVTEAEYMYDLGDHIRQNWIFQKTRIGNATTLAGSIYAIASRPDIAQVPDISKILMKIVFQNNEGFFIDQSGGIIAGTLNGLADYFSTQLQMGSITEQAVRTTWTRMSTSSSVPNNAVAACLFMSGRGLVAIDAAQLEPDEQTEFDPSCRNMTLEYETDSSGVHTAEVELNPAMNTNNSGFLIVSNEQDPATD